MLSSVEFELQQEMKTEGVWKTWGFSQSPTEMEAKLPHCLINTITAVLVFAVAMTMDTRGSEIMVDNFRSSSEQSWQFFAHTVTGGTSAGQVVFMQEGDTAYASMSGRLSGADNGGFIQIRKQLGSSPPEGTKGVLLVVRGNGEQYFVHLCTSDTLLPRQYYQAGFSTTTSWREIKLPLESFTRSSDLLRQTPTASSLKSVSIVAFGRDYQADVQVREVRFY